MTAKKRPDRQQRQVAAIRSLLGEGCRVGVETRKELGAGASEANREKHKVRFHYVENW